jgi:hypothetical protein
VSRSFVGNDYILSAYDLGNDLAPLGDAAFSGVNGLDLTDAQLLVTSGAGGTAVYDLTDLTDVEQLFLSETVRSRAVAVGASAAWIPADEGVYRLSLGETPTLSAPVAMPVEGANQALAAGGLLTVISDRGRLVTVDVSAETPVLRASPEISIAGNAIGVRVAGNRFLVADGAGGLRVGTLHDLAGTGRGYADVMVDFEDVVVDGDIAYAADWFFGLRVYDISDPDDVVQIGALDTPGAPSAVAFEDGRVYLGESTGGGAVRVIDVSDPTAPEELGFVETSIVFDLVVRDKLVYTANHTLGDSGGLYVFDATDPAAPALAGSYTECSDASGIDLVEDLAIIGCGGEFHLVDVSDPSAPDQVSAFSLTGTSGAWAVAIRGDVAYLGHDTGVTVVDIGDPAAPAKVRELATAYSVRGLDASLPGRLVAAAGLAGIYQWDLE